MSVQHEMMPATQNPEGTAPPEVRYLMPDEHVAIYLSAPLETRQDEVEQLRIPGNVVATVRAGGKEFFVLDIRGKGTNRAFIVADHDFSREPAKGYKGIEEGGAVLFGRDHLTDRFSYPGTMSRDHFEILYTDGVLAVHNLKPMNDTIVTARLARESQANQIEPRYDVVDNRTNKAVERLRSHPNYGEKDETAPYGYHLNHPLLGRNSMTVENGVYAGAHSREAIVVDGKSEILKQVYTDLAHDVRQAFEANQTLPVQTILLGVAHKVQTVMPYDGPKTSIISELYRDDSLVGLSTYVKEGAGVCRHQGLLAAYLIENLIKDGFMEGGVGIERNTVQDLGGTHAWAIYKTDRGGEGEAIIVDPAQSFVGTKAQAQQQERWEYSLSTDEY